MSDEVELGGLFFCCLRLYDEQPPRAIRDPTALGDSDRLTIQCTQTELGSAKQKRLVKEWCEVLPRLDHVRFLWLDSLVPQQLFDAVCRMRGLVGLEVRSSRIKRLEAIREARTLRHVRLGMSPQVESIEPLGGLIHLKSLGLENLKRITDLRPLAGLSELEGFSFTGGLWATQKVESLSPLSAMRSLRYLILIQLHCVDESLRPLEPLRSLTKLQLSVDKWPVEELAWIYARFASEVHGFEPCWELHSSSIISNCKRCRNDSMVLILGKGGRRICSQCDSAQLGRSVAYFNECVKGFS
jgi:hypothetical protein